MLPFLRLRLIFYCFPSPLVFSIASQEHDGASPYSGVPFSASAFWRNYLGLFGTNPLQRSRERKEEEEEEEDEPIKHVAQKGERYKQHTLSAERENRSKTKQQVNM